MNTASQVALQVLVTAQVFLLGLAAGQFQSEVVSRLRSRLDALRVRMQLTSSGTFDPDQLERLSLEASSVGLDLDEVERRGVPRELLTQFVVSIVVLAIAIGVLWVAAADRHLSIFGNPIRNPSYAGGYAILAAACLAPASILMQLFLARRFLISLRDRVLASANELPEARIAMASGLGPRSDRQSLESARQIIDIQERYRAYGDPQSAAIASKVVLEAAERVNGRDAAETVSCRLEYSVALSALGRLVEAREQAEMAYRAAVAASIKPVRLHSGRVLAERLADLGSSKEALRFLTHEMEAAVGLSKLHPAMLSARLTRAALLAECEQYADALDLATESIHDLKRAVRSSDPALIRAELNAAEIKVRAGHIRGALDDLERLVAETEVDYGRDHLVSLESRRVLGATEVISGNISGGKGLLEDVAASALSNLGPDHLLALETSLLLLELRDESGSSLDSPEDLFARCTRVLGVAHPLTSRAQLLLPGAESQA